MRKAFTVIIAFLLTSGTVLAGSQTDPEIQDETGDVDIQHLVDTDVLSHIDAPNGEIETSGDVVKAWIHDETPRAFTITIELADLPEDLETDGPLVEVWTHATIREGDYHTRSALAGAGADEPLTVEHEIYLDETRVGSLSGGVDVGEDRVWVRVPKADVRDPGGDDQLTDFHVTTHVPESGAVLDYAPGTARQSVPALVEAQAAEPTALDLSADPEYGDAYTFRAFEQGDSRLTVDATPDNMDVPAGEQAEFAIRVTNAASQAEDVSLGVLDAPQGWSARVQPSSLSVPASSSLTASLFVTPADDASGHALIEVAVTGERGAYLGAIVSVLAVPPGADEGGEADGDGGWQEGQGSNGEDASSDPEADAGGGDGDADADEDGEASGPGDEDDGRVHRVPFSPWIAGLVSLAAARFSTRRKRS